MFTQKQLAPFFVTGAALLVSLAVLLPFGKEAQTNGHGAEMVQLHRAALERHTPGDPHRARYLDNLANALRSRYTGKRTGSEEDLAETVRLRREALELRPPGHPLRDASLNNLAIAVRDRYSRTGSEDDLVEEIRLLRECLDLCTPGHPHRDMPLNNLANALCNRHSRTGLVDDLAETIRLHRESLELRPAGHPLRGTSLNNLANALSYCYTRTGSQDDLVERVKLLSECLDLCPPGHPHRDIPLNNLANALYDRYRRTGSENDLAETIRLHRESLELRPSGHPLRGTSLNNLAGALSNRYRRTGSENDLAETIRLHRESLDLCPPGHPHRDIPLNNLASALSDRYRRTGLEGDLVEEIRLLRECLDLCTPGHPHRDMPLNNLANALNERYSRTGSEDDLAETIRLHRECLELRPSGHPLRDTYLNNLASALSDRYRRTGLEGDLVETFRLHRESLDLCPPGHPHRDIPLNNLANALYDRYCRTGSEDDLADTIRLHRESLELRPSGHPFRRTSISNLAAALGERFRRTGSEDDLAKMIQLCREALKLSPPGHPRHANALLALARGMWDRDSADPLPNADEVFALLREGSIDPISPVQDSLRCARIWVAWAHHIRHHTLGSAYEHSVQSLRHYLTIGPTVKLQYEALTRQASFLSLPMDAAAHFIQNGDIGRAVEILDEGRALLWSEMRRFRKPLLQDALAGDKLGAAFEVTCSELRHISTAEARYETMSARGGLRDAGVDSLSTGIPYDVLLAQKRKLLQKYDELLDLIRKKPRLEDFLRRPPFNQLKEAAKEGPVIIVNCSKFGSHVVIVFPDRSPLVITLDEDDLIQFYDRAADIHKLYLDALQVTKDAENASSALGLRLKPITQQLWDLVVSKVVDELKRAGVPNESRIWWCPTSVLTALPFHAAGDGNNYLIDSYISSYTPTLKALIDARQPSSPSATKEPDSLYPRLLVVAQTITSGLESAGDELDIMRRLGTFVDILDGPDATQQSVLQNLPAYDWAHFICHGTLAESSDAFSSSLHLHGGDTLSLHDIIKADLPDAKFAFLAACHTAEQGRGPTVLQDEILHLAGAMQFSGFRSVVGTMWEMEDEDGPKVAKLFYREMLKEDDDPMERHTRAARTLWKVTRRMKATRVSLDRWVNFVHIGA